MGTVNEESMTDREVLDTILASQERTEAMMQSIMEAVGPMVETVRAKGLLGLLSARTV